VFHFVILLFLNRLHVNYAFMRDLDSNRREVITSRLRGREAMQAVPLQPVVR
jgi:hypothetical protein